MAINANDIRLMRAERTTQEADGGGAMTGEAVVSGDVNNLFADVSQNRQARGGVDLVKLFGAVRSANADALLGAGMMLTKDAVADNISTLLFYTGDQYDERAAAKDAIEQFVVLSTRSGLRPVGTQRAGQTSLVLYTDSLKDEPEVGDVLFLISGQDQQPVKVLSTEGRRTQYSWVDEQSQYQQYDAYEITLRISQRLKYDFVGSEPSPVAHHSTEIFKTQSNSSAKYYGMKPLAAAAASGEAGVTVDSIFQPIVPASTAETPLLDRSPGVLQQVVQPGATTNQVRTLGALSGSQQFTLPTAWVPGSLRVSVGSSEYDEFNGSLRLLSGSDYLSDVSLLPLVGVLSFSLSSTQSVVVRYQPGAAIDLTPYTDSVEIVAGNRQLSYTEQLSPAPLPGSVKVEYSYLGKWYTLTDDGTGTLTGPSSSGAINYDTGSVSLSLPGEPDVGSRIIYTWAQSPYEIGGATTCDAWLEIELEDQPLAGTLTVDWSRSGIAHSAAAGADDVLSNGAGQVAGDRLLFTPGNLPTSALTINYDKHNAATLTSAIAVSEQTGEALVLDIGAANLVPGSVAFELEFSVASETLDSGEVFESRIASTARITCDAQGVLRWANVGYRACGSVDAVAGTVTIDLNEFTRPVPLYTHTDAPNVLGGYQRQYEQRTMRLEAQTVTVSYRSSTAAIPVTAVVELADIPVRIPLAAEPMVPGCQLILLGNDELVDRGDGALYRAWNMTTAAGLLAGSIDYINGMAEVSYSAVQGSIGTLDAERLSAALGTGAAAAVTSVTFRTSASPLRASGLQFLARRATDGALMRAESDAEGTISGGFDDSDRLTHLEQPGTGYVLRFIPTTTGWGSATGEVDSQSGVVEISFTQPVILSTLTYNAVAYTTLPQDPERLGLDPVRLPTNGTVPIFNDGYLVAVHNTQQLTEASPVAAQVIDCGRGDLARVVITDALGAALALDQYSVNLATGHVTLADPFDAVDADGSSLTMPLTIAHRVEDRAVVTRASVTGELSLNLQLTHDYPQDGSYVSGIVEFGDLQSRVHGLAAYRVDESSNFDNGYDGEAAVASYNDLDFPLLYDNLGSVQEKWKLKFIDETNFQCIAEQRGLVGSGSINADFAPLNPATNTPYFTIRANGWGGGWLSSNVLRFDTDVAADAVWIIRTTTPSNQQIDDDSVVIEFMGDAD